MACKNLRISLFSYFFLTFVLDGLQRLSGLFVLELLQTTSVTRQNAVVPFIISWAVSKIIASFSDILVDSKRSEYVILFGVLLTAVGAATCALATNITALIVFWGLIFGSGYGLASPHLSKRLKNMNSAKIPFILQVTPNLGITIMPFVFNILTSYYGLQGSYLIFCGIILNYLPLVLATAYKIEISFPSIKWRVRKKSSQYTVTKQDGRKTVSNESFISSLEPDLILKISQSEEYQDEITGGKSQFSTNEIMIPIGRKRSETRGNDLQGLEINKRIFPQSKSHSQMVIEVNKYEKERREKLFEGSFINKDTSCDEMKQTLPNTDVSINCDTTHSIKILEKILNTDTKTDLNLKDKIMQFSEKNETCGENKELKKNCLEIFSRNKIAVSENTTSQNLGENEDNNTLQNNVKHKNEREISLTTECKQKLNCLPTKKFERKKPFKKENLQISPCLLENERAFNLPLDIKIHVEECTFVAGEKYWNENVNSKYLKTIKNNYRNHSNSVLLDIQENINFASQKFSKNFLKCSEFRKPNLPSIYSISENPELNDKKGISGGEKYIKNNSNQTKVKRFFKFISEITSRVFLCITLITVIFEINLVTLLTMFADFGNDVDNDCSDFKWILVVFGAGGLLGKFCCCKISRTIPEKSHSVGVVLFLLTGLSTAGVLYSPNLNWLGGFYCILGALEGGITYTVPKLILDYTDTDAHSMLPSVKNFFSGLAIISIPYVIGLFRDEMGNYEFLLQTLSCSSVLCAFLSYLLPYLQTASNKQIVPSFRSKTETI